MAYPFASLGSFNFQRDETPLYGTDTGWRTSLSLDRSRPLGSATDSIVTLAVGSSERSFEVHVEPDRYSSLLSLLNTTVTMTDWTRPAPDSRSAFVSAVTRLGDVAALCTDGVTRRKIRARVELISQ